MALRNRSWYLPPASPRGSSLAEGRYRLPVEEESAMPIRLHKRRRRRRWRWRWRSRRIWDERQVGEMVRVKVREVQIRRTAIPYVSGRE